MLTPGAEGMTGASAPWSYAQELGAYEPRFLIRNSSRTRPTRRSIGKPRPRRSGSDTDGQVDIFVAGVGTGGTITGVAEVAQGTQTRPSGSSRSSPVDSPVLSGGKAGPHKIQGIGAGFVPKVLRTDLLDEIIQVRHEDAGETTRRLAMLEGILAGISAGANVSRTLQVELARKAEVN